MLCKIAFPLPICPSWNKIKIGHFQNKDSVGGCGMEGEIVLFMLSYLIRSASFTCRLDTRDNRAKDSVICSALFSALTRLTIVSLVKHSSQHPNSSGRLGCPPHESFSWVHLGDWKRHGEASYVLGPCICSRHSPGIIGNFIFWAWSLECWLFQTHFTSFSQRLLQSIRCYFHVPRRWTHSCHRFSLNFSCVLCNQDWRPPDRCHVLPDIKNKNF